MDASRQRHSFNVAKNKIVSVHSPALSTCTLNNKPLKSLNMETHLGICRNAENSNHDTIDNRVKSYNEYDIYGIKTTID